MTYSFKLDPTPLRGGAAVGLLPELPALERTAIVMLRLWCDNAQGPALVEQALAQTFGPDRARRDAPLLAHLVALFTTQARRPLMRHDLTCTCFGGDEAAFAHLIAAATVQDRDDALAFAMLFLPAAPAFDAVLTAEALGPALLSLARAGTHTHH